MKHRLTEYLLAHADEQLPLLESICTIPAPSNMEAERARYIESLLAPYGSVEVDEALSAVYTEYDNGGEGALLIVAHIDTVFPLSQPLSPKTEDGWYCCPGAGDNGANVAAMVMLIKALRALQAVPTRPVIFAAVSGEEGLGNLKGTKALLERYGSRVTDFISLDGGFGGIVNDAVGSHRYRVSVKTQGGHSFGNFGRRNAIAALAELISELYKITPPTEAYTTYNVGGISGGTSINTIAARAEMLYEYRSESRACLAEMERRFHALIAKANSDPEAEVTAEVLGLRPCSGDVPADRLAALTALAKDVIREVLPQQEIVTEASSTDCNIPLSLGIPAVCFGLCESRGAHTADDRVLISSLETGLRVGAALMARFFRLP